MSAVHRNTGGGVWAAQGLFDTGPADTWTKAGEFMTAWCSGEAAPQVLSAEFD